MWVLLGMLVSFGGEARASSEIKPIKLGVMLGLGSDPYPSALGINGFLTVMDLVRFHIGFGAVKLLNSVFSSSVSTTISSTTGLNLSEQESTYTWGLGAHARLPGFGFSPTLGLSLSRSTVQANATRFFGDVDQSGTIIYPSVGVEWTPIRWFFLGTGMNFPFQQSDDSQEGWTYVSGFWGYLNAGFQF